MPKKRVTPKRPRDTNQLAKRIVDVATGEVEDDTPTVPDEKATRRGEIRARFLTPERRREIAQKAASKRWEKKNGHP